MDASIIDKEHFIEVLEALHTEQTGLSNALNKVLDTLNSYSWLAEGGRACYEYDNDEYYQEIGRCFDAISDVIAAALTTNDSHQICCGKYRQIARHAKVPLQRRIRMGQLYNDITDDLMDLALIEGEL